MRLLFLVITLALSLPGFAHASLPNGSPHLPLPAECWPDQALQALQATVPLTKKMKVVQAWITRCEPRWAYTTPSQLLVLTKYVLNRYPSNQPYIRKLILPLADGRKLRGIFATKPGDKPRDLVIFRCGVFCDSDDSSSLFNALMNVFEENPVHLLFLNSASGIEYAKDNGAAHIGGFDEGYQNLEMAKYVLARQAQFGIKVRKVHVMGMSLGGLSVLFSSMYADTVSEFSNVKFGSFVALCPLVDTGSEFNDVLSGGNFASTVFRYRTRKIFRGLPNLLAPLTKIFGGVKPSKMEKDNINIALDLSAHYYAENWDRLAFSAYIPRPKKMDRDSLLEESNVLLYDNRYSPNTVVLHAQNDMLVPWPNNSSKLQGVQPDHLGVLHTLRGNHCGFTQALDWQFLTQFVSGLINEPKDLPRVRHALPASVEAFMSKPLRFPGDAYSHYQWSVDSGAAYAKLKVWAFKSAQCSNQKPDYAQPENPMACQDFRVVKVPLNELAAVGMPSKAADEFSASRMERYLNGRTRFLDGKGRRAVGDHDAPQWLESQGRFSAVYGVL